MTPATCSSPFWDPALESLNRGNLERLQLERLRATLARAGRSPHYRRVFSALDFDPRKISSLAALRELPFTVKDDLRSDENFPYGFLTVRRDRLVRLHSSSGTTGRPTAVFHTRRDLAAWADLVARSLWMIGMRPGDVFQNMMGYGLFTGGLGLHYGAERLGALTIPAGAGNSRRQIALMRDFGTTALHVIPSYALRLIDTFREVGEDPLALGLRFAVLGAEPHSEAARRRIEELFGLRAFNCYGLSELNGPGVAFECPAQDGLHLWEDAYLAEIVDPESGRPVPDGARGELVLTNLTREGMPLVRYRTRDVTSLRAEPCRCGRTHRRIERITGRTDDMLIVKGVNIYPVQVERVLLRFAEIGSDYLIVLATVNHLDQLTVRAELKPDAFRGDLHALEALRRRIADELRGEILVSARVDLLEHGSLPRGEGKAVRVQDTRER
ncbi:MAG TPA: phenylacetate--CoA ligase [Candidatus Methanoperedens sp.]|nr:phenylacetate--CoA ligase [Candidatus Methanoperedens sp.]